MDLENWKSMLHFDDEKIVMRVIENDQFFTPYYYGDKPVDDALVKEIHDFNQFAIAHTGKPVYDEDVPPLECGMAEVDRYFVDLGRARW